MTPKDLLILECGNTVSPPLIERVFAQTQYEPDRLDALVEASKNLREIVEGVRSERWAFGGLRLKDTQEWVVFYVALANFKLSGANATREPSRPTEGPQQ